MSKLQSFCCICMQKAKILVSLESLDSNNVEYIEKLNFCVPKQIWKQNHQICNSCMSQLDVAHNFIQSCLESEHFRKELDSSLLKTLNTDVKNISLSIKGETKFTCDQCNKSFREKKYLSQHITKLHINKKRETKIKNFKKEQEEDKSVLDLLGQDSDKLKLDLENTVIKQDGPIKEEDIYTVVNYNKLDKSEENDFKKVKIDPSDTEDLLGDTTDVANDIDNYDNFSAESEGDNDVDEPDTTTGLGGKKRGPKKKPQKCSFCDEIFSKRHEWATHIRTKHTFEKPFSCDECDARYMNGYSLLIHKRKHTNEKPFICATCGKSFVSSADLNHHNKTHDADRAYPCPACDRSFKTHSNLRTHRLQMHLDPADWKFHCHLCDKKFPIRGNLKKHLKRHAGIKEFDCHICAKSFVNKAELTLHLNTHTNQRLFKCKLCGRDYKNREGLRRHMKVVHDQGNWKAPKSDKKLLCPMCPKIFAFGNKLQRHIFTHTGEKPFKCDYCQKRFIDNYGRKVHYKKDHNVEFYS